MTPWTRSAAVAALVAALALVPAAAAQADTSRASANALGVTTSAGVTVTSPAVSASSDGTAADSSSQPSGVLGGQSLVTAGVVVAQVVARVDGTSASCAGLVGSGGSVTIGSDGSCTTNAGSGGIRVELSPLVTLTATAITSSCTARSTGGSTTRTTIVGGKVNGASFSAGSSGGLGLLGLISLGTGAASTSSAGSGPVSTTALDLSLLSGTAAVRIGSVTCGQNAVVVPTPALPLGGWPVALAGAAVAVLGGRALLRSASSSRAPRVSGGAA